MSIAKTAAMARKKTPRTGLACPAGLVSIVRANASHVPVKIPNAVPTSESRPRNARMLEENCSGTAEPSSR
jgi:hypothetical protein